MHVNKSIKSMHVKCNGPFSRSNATLELEAKLHIVSYQQYAYGYAQKICKKGIVAIQSNKTVCFSTR